MTSSREHMIMFALCLTNCAKDVLRVLFDGFLVATHEFTSHSILAATWMFVSSDIAAVQMFGGAGKSFHRDSATISLISYEIRHKAAGKATTFTVCINESLQYAMTLCINSIAQWNCSHKISHTGISVNVVPVFLLSLASRQSSCLNWNDENKNYTDVTRCFAF